MCSSHDKFFFLPVDIRHNQCPCRFFNPTYLQRQKFCGSEPLERVITAVCSNNKQSRQRTAMYVIMSSYSVLLIDTTVNVKNTHRHLLDALGSRPCAQRSANKKYSDVNRQRRDIQFWGNRWLTHAVYTTNSRT